MKVKRDLIVICWLAWKNILFGVRSYKCMFNDYFTSLGSNKR